MQLLNVMKSLTSQHFQLIEASQVLHETGIKNEFLVKIEEALTDPAKSLSEIQDSIDTEVSHIVDAFMVDFIKSKKNIISGAYRAETPDKALFYCVQLKEESFNSRLQLNEYFTTLYNVVDLNRHFVYMCVVDDISKSDIPVHSIIKL